MKKFRVLLLMMIAVVFSVTGCGKDTGLPYEYDQQRLIDNAKTNLEYMLNLSESGQKYTIAQGEEPFSGAVSNLVTAYEESGAYVSLKETQFTEKEDSIEIILLCAFEKNDVEAVFTYEPNSVYDYKDVYQNADEILPYVATEITIQSVYSMGYYIKQAGMNTLMGMGTVFAVLLFISFIISFFKYIPMMMEKQEKKKIAKANKNEPAAPVAEATPIVAPVTENLMDDSELVAVITAAIYAASGSNNATSKDTLIVRSISRARK